MNWIKIVLSFLALLCFHKQCTAQSEAELIRFPYISKNEGEAREFYLYLPKGYHTNPDSTWPVLMFLHGNGERGNGRDELDWVLMHGPLYEAWIQKRDLPFIIIAPQLPMWGMDTVATYIRSRDTSSIPKRMHEGVPDRPKEFDTPQWMNGSSSTKEFPFVLPLRGWQEVEEDLMGMVNTVLTQFKGDPDRVYLTGLSYGGYATWYLAYKYSEVWAAIMPVVGWGHPDHMDPIATFKIPVWVFAGGRDTTVPVRYFYPGLNRLERMGHTDVRFTIHADMGHDVWRRVYAGEDIYTWLLSQKRK